MDQVEVDVLEPEFPAAPFEGAQRGVETMVAVPEFRRDEDLVARNAALADGRSHISFVSVHFRGVDHSVAAFEGGGDGLPGLLAGARLPHAQAEDGDLPSIVECDPGVDREGHRPGRRPARYLNLDRTGRRRKWMRILANLKGPRALPDSRSRWARRTEARAWSIPFGRSWSGGPMRPSPTPTRRSGDTRDDRTWSPRVQSTPRWSRCCGPRVPRSGTTRSRRRLVPTRSSSTIRSS